jgi:hypothetical protein
MDIRIYWSGNLTSATVFGGEPVKPAAKSSEDGTSIEGHDTGGEEEDGGGKYIQIHSRILTHKFFHLFLFLLFLL